MKKIMLSCLMMAGLVVFLSSCKDDENGPSGNFTYDGESFKLSKGFASLDDQWSDGDDTWYEWEVTLTSSGIKYDDAEEEYMGKGDAIVLELYIKNNDDFLPPGTYRWDEDAAYFDGVYIDYNVETGEGQEVDVSSQDMVVTITKSGSTYTITVTSDDLNATYEGKITHLIEDEEPA